MISKSPGFLLTALMMGLFGLAASDCFGQSIQTNNFYFPTGNVSNQTGDTKTMAAVQPNAVPQTGTAAPNISYVTPQVYTVNTAITPLQPTNAGGAVPATIYGQVTTFAGNGSAGSTNGAASSASFSTPYGLTIDASANIFVADYGNQAIRKITPAGVVSTYAGTGGSGINNGAAASATFNCPGGVTVDALGTVYVGDQLNDAIRKITTTGIVSTYSGTGSPGSANGTLTTATYNGPAGLTFDPNGNLYVADRNNNLVRKITPTGTVSSISGGFFNCSGLGSDINGNIFVTDQFNNLIKKISPTGSVTIFAGTGAVGTTDGAGTTASFYKPFGLAADLSGVIYVADEFNNLIRTISPTGYVATVAGNGAQASIDGNGKNASFYYPCGVALDGLGNLFVTDAGSNKIRKVIVTGYTIDKALPAGLSFDPTTGIISGTPTVTSPATDYLVTAYNVGGSSSTVVNIAVTSTLLPSIITFPILPQNTGSNLITPAATSTNNETPIIYTSSNTAVSIITSNGQVQLVGRGVTTITASQAGNIHYTTATPVSQQMTVTESVLINFPVLAATQTCAADFSANARINDTSVPLSYSSSDPTVATISSTGTIHVLKAGTTTITAFVSNVQYVAPASVSQTLTVNTPAAITAIIVPSNISVCAGTTVTFTMNVATAGASFPANTQFQWTLNGTAVTNNTTGTYVSSSIASTDVIACVATPPVASCNTPVTAIYTGLVVNPMQTPSVTISSSATSPVCPGTSITFTAIPTNGGGSPGYQWQVNGTTVSATGAQFATTALSNGDRVTCTLTNTAGVCLTANTAQSNTIITQIITLATPLPTVTIAAASNTVYSGTAVTFTAHPANAGLTIDYQWQINGVNVGTDSQNFTTASLNNGDQVTCIMTATLACQVFVTSNVISMTILPPLNITVSNTFTPNGDGVNDTWSIPALNSYPNCLVTVFNRYGAAVFQSKGYSIPWDGTGKDHQQIPDGVYYYIIEPGNKTTPKVSGWIAIVR